MHFGTICFVFKTLDLCGLKINEFVFVEEADLDEDKKLSEVEFELMLSKSPDFLG